MSFDRNEVTKKITDMTQEAMDVSLRNIFKETLRELKQIFGNIHYTDAEGNLVKVHCHTGKQERAIGKLLQENNLVLPFITLVEDGIDNNNNRNRISNIVVSETAWDAKRMKAIRVLSLPPRPINISYNVNVWCKYAEDMDMIRSNIISKFNPHLTVPTKFSDFSLAYFRNEMDMEPATANDTADRVLKKSMKIIVETFIPSPKFLYTNTGQIEAFNYDIEITS